MLTGCIESEAKWQSGSEKLSLIDIGGDILLIDFKTEDNLVIVFSETNQNCYTCKVRNDAIWNRIANLAGVKMIKVVFQRSNAENKNNFREFAYKTLYSKEEFELKRAFKVKDDRETTLVIKKGRTVFRKYGFLSMNDYRMIKRIVLEGGSS